VCVCVCAVRALAIPYHTRPALDYVVMSMFVPPLPPSPFLFHFSGTGTGKNLPNTKLLFLFRRRCGPLDRRNDNVVWVGGEVGRRRRGGEKGEWRGGKRQCHPDLRKTTYPSHTRAAISPGVRREGNGVEGKDHARAFKCQSLFARIQYA